MIRGMETHETCRAFLDQWPEVAFRDPDGALDHALQGLSRVKELGNPPELLARALAYLGSSYRLLGKTDEALETLDEGLGLYHLSELPVEDEADIRRRLTFALLDSSKKRPEALSEALDSADHARRLYMALGLPEKVARCHLAIAEVFMKQRRYTDAFEHYSTHLPMLSGIYLDSALQNIQVALLRAYQHSQSIPPSLRTQALKNIRTVRLSSRTRAMWNPLPDPTRRRSFGRNKSTPADAKVRWAIGVLLALERDYKPAARHLESGRAELARLGMRLNVAEISLDLGQVYARLRSWRKLTRLASETIELLEESAPAETLEAFRLWQLAIKGQDADQLRAHASQIYAILEAA
jgi:tetratricopeptide (TPR) repeat protein